MERKGQAERDGREKERWREKIEVIGGGQGRGRGRRLPETAEGGLSKKGLLIPKGSLCSNVEK